MSTVMYLLVEAATHDNNCLVMKLVRRLCYLAVLNHASNPLHHALYCVVVIVGKNKGNGELVMDFSRTISHVIFRNDDSRGRLILKVVLGVWGEGVGWCEVWCVGWNVGWGGGGGNVGRGGRGWNVGWGGGEGVGGCLPVPILIHKIQ